MNTNTDQTQTPQGTKTLPGEPSGLALDVLGTLVNRAYDRAKTWAGVGLCLQILLFGAGVVAIFWPAVTLSYPWVAVPLALIGAEIARRASNYKGMAEAAKRQHEYVVGFGLKPSTAQLADLRQSLQNELSPEMDRLLKLGITYASTEPYGPRRALENLCESSWYTKHLANRCMMWVGATVMISMTVAISLLLWSSSSLPGTFAGFAAAKSVAATFTFLISVGAVRSWVGFAKLSHKAKDIDSEACKLLAGGEPDGIEVQRLLSEYQIARASAALIPTRMWRLHQNSMNEDWKLRTCKA